MLASGTNEHPACACAHTRSRHCTLPSGEEAQHTRLRRARAARRRLESLHVPYEATAAARGLPPTVHGRAPTCQPRPPTPSKRRVSRGAGVIARSLCLGRRRSTRACRARAKHCAGCGRSKHYTRPLRQLEVSLLRCTAVLRYASPGLQRQACAVSREEQAPLRALSLRRRRITRACGACAPRCAACWSVYALYKATAPARVLSLSVHGRAPTCQHRVPTSNRLARVRTRDRATARSLSGEEAQHASLRRALPRRAGWSRSVHRTRPLHQREASLLRCTAVRRRASYGL